MSKTNLVEFKLTENQAEIVLQLLNKTVERGECAFRQSLGFQVVGESRHKFESLDAAATRIREALSHA